MMLKHTTAIAPHVGVLLAEDDANPHRQADPLRPVRRRTRRWPVSRTLTVVYAAAAIGHAAVHPWGAFGTAFAGNLLLLVAPMLAARQIMAFLDHRELSRVLLERANVDPVTRLANRHNFVSHAANLLANEPAVRNPVMVFLDLDDFKLINDSFGHESGDRVLEEVGRRLLAATRPGDHVARLGGDEFGILLEDISTTATKQVASRIVTELSRPMEIAGHRFAITGSMGIARYDTTTADVPEWMAKADLAMYAAKREGRSPYAFYQPAMRVETLARVDMIQRLREAVTGGEIRVVYQPIIDLSSERVVALEALARWDNPKHGVITPAEFIPLAEKTGLILPLGWMVMRAACAATMRWNRLFSPAEALQINVNVSPQQLLDTGFLSELQQLVRFVGIRPETLVIEVTEGIMSDETAITTLHAARALGFVIAIDDFGTGFSSLSTLRDMPADIVKVDAAFVRRMNTNSNDAQIVRSILSLVNTLGTLSLAEGIEEPAQHALLKAWGCKQGQGFLLARPMEEQDVEAFLLRNRGPFPPWKESMT